MQCNAVHCGSSLRCKHGNPTSKTNPNAALDAGAAARIAAHLLRLSGEAEPPRPGTGGPPDPASSAVSPHAALPGAQPSPARQRAAQFIAVSHKAEVFEQARRLLGVYVAAHGGSAAVVAAGF
jgi:hypothetical protein